jgi:hypothetical protein
MTSRRLVTFLITLLVPLALGMLTLGASRAAPSAGVAVSSNMGNCHDQGGPMPAKGADCQTDCPLVCSPIGPGRVALDAPIRPYTRLHYDLDLHGLVGRALKPELPPPRRDPT